MTVKDKLVIYETASDKSFSFIFLLFTLLQNFVILQNSPTASYSIVTLMVHIKLTKEIDLHLSVSIQQLYKNFH